MNIDVKDELPSNLYACKCPTGHEYDDAKSTNAVKDLFAQNVTHQRFYCKEDCVSAKMNVCYSNSGADHCSKTTDLSGRAKL